MKLKHYQIATRYKNKMDDFHGWGCSCTDLIISRRTTRHDAKCHLTGNGMIQERIFIIIN